MTSISPEESIFCAAIELKDAAAREDFLARECGEDKALRRRVNDLLSAYGEGSFLESPAADIAATELQPPLLGERSGDWIGPYKLLEQIGEGGMGLVFMAEQSQPLRRRVALKVIKPGLDTQAVIARFEAERQALAWMDHPNIARVLDAGATNSGRPYFAMELVRGAPITDYCRDGGVSLRDRLKLFIDVCQAVQHAHQKGIIHRDLKPTNILVSQTDTASVPKVIDFGIAKATAAQTLTDKTLFTHFTQIMGTPLYMSPEQADRGNQDIDTRSDVYSLGVVLYELLTGSTPFDSERLRSSTPDEMLRTIRDVDPPRPSDRVVTLKNNSSDTATLRSLSHSQIDASSLRGDLDWIVMKAIEKDRRRRYDSPNALVDDLQRYLDHEPVLARPPSIQDKLTKWSRRHVNLIWSGLALAAVISIASVISTLLLAQSRNDIAQQRAIAIGERNSATHERNAALDERNKASLAQYNAEIVSSQIDISHRNFSGVRAVLASHLPVAGRPDHRGWEWYFLQSLCHPEMRTLRTENSAPFAAWSPDGKLTGAPGVIWDNETSTRTVFITPSRLLTKRGDWSPDGNHFAWGTASDDSGIYVWNRPTNRLNRLIPQTKQITDLGSTWCVAWSPDGTQLASCGTDRKVRIWDLASRSLLRTIPMQENVVNVTWRPDSTALAATPEGSLVLLDPRSGATLSEWRHSTKEPAVIDWSPDGRQLYFADLNSWRILRGDDLTVQRMYPLSRGGREIACSPDGTMLAVAAGETVIVWNLSLDRLETELIGHLLPVASVDWNPDGTQILTCSANGEVKTWNVRKPSSIARFNGPVDSIYWSKEGDTLHAWSRSNANNVGDELHPDETTLRLTRQLPDSLCSNRDGTVVAIDRSESADPSIEIMDVATRQTRAIWRIPTGHQMLEEPCTGLSDDGSRLAIVTVADGKQLLTLWNVAQERTQSTRQWSNSNSWEFARSPSWSPNQQYVSFIGWGDIGDNGLTYWKNHIHVIDAGTGQRILKHHSVVSQSITASEWSPDSKLIAIGTNDGFVEVLDVVRQQVVFSRKVHHGTIFGVVWHPDGTRLASSSVGGNVKILTETTGQPLLTFELTQSTGAHLAWSSDGRQLAAVTPDGAEQIWNASTGFEVASGGKRRGELAWEYHDQAQRVGGEEARRTLQEVVRYAPDTLDYWTLRGNSHAMLSDFERAAEEFAKLTGPDYQRTFVPALDLARCYFAAGRWTEYQRVCSSLVDAIEATDIPSNTINVIELCTLSPQSAVDAGRLLVMLKSHMTRFDESSLGHFDANVASCLLRERKYDESLVAISNHIGQFQEGSDPIANGRLSHAKYRSAIVRAHLGQTAQAQRLFAEANEHAAQAGDLQWNWRTRVALDAARQEAEAALRRPKQGTQQ